MEEKRSGGPRGLRRPQVLQPSPSHWEDFPDSEDQFDSDRAEGSEKEKLEEEVGVTDGGRMI